MIYFTFLTFLATLAGGITPIVARVTERNAYRASLIAYQRSRRDLDQKEDEIAAQAMGINVRFYKTFSFVIGAFFAGLAGFQSQQSGQYQHQ